MPAPKPANQRREDIIPTRLTRTEGARLRAAAARQRTTVAALIRHSLYAAGHLPTQPR